MQKKLDTIILAAGKGERMTTICKKYDVPKHLLPIGENETVIGRLVKQVNQFSRTITCVVPEVERDKFDDFFSNTSQQNFRLVSSKAESFSVGIIEGLNGLSSDSQVLVTTGDLVFSDEVIKNIEQDTCTRLKIFTDKNEVKKLKGFPLRFIKTPYETLSNFAHSSLDPESFRSVFSFFLNELLKNNFRVGNAEALANLNTPEDFFRMQNLFSKNYL